MIENIWYLDGRCGLFERYDIRSFVQRLIV